MALMFAGVIAVPSTTGHDVGSRVKAIPFFESRAQRFVVRIKTKRRQCYRPERFVQQFPGFNLVEDLEQQDSKKQISTRKASGVDHIANQVLAYTIRRAVRVRKLVMLQYWIVCPGWVRIPQSTKEDLLPFRCKAPVRSEDECRLQRSEKSKIDITGLRRWCEHPHLHAVGVEIVSGILGHFK